MVKKIFMMSLALLLITAGVVMFLTSDAYAARLTQKQLSFVDEFGELISHTTLTSVEILDAGTATTSSIYSDRNGDTSMTNPIVTGLAADQITFWSKDADYKCSATDGTYTRAVDNLTGSQTRFAFPTYLVAMASRTASDSQTFTFGTTLDWVAGAQDTTMDWTPKVDNSAFAIGTSALASDLELYGGTPNYDLLWDSNRNTLAFRDNAILGFGCGSKGGTVDYTIQTAGSTGNLVITAVTGDDCVEFGDGSVATDVLFQNTQTATADVRWDDATETWLFGVTDYGVDVKFWGDSGGNYMMWDESEDEHVFEDAKIVLNEGSDIIFQDSGDATDWTMDCATGDQLRLICAATNETPSVTIGATTSGADLKVWGTDGTDYIEWDASADLHTIVGDAVAWTLTEAASTAVNIDITGTAGGFDLDTTDGVIALTAGGASNGDITLTSGDDIICTMTGVMRIVDDDIMVFGTNDDVSLNYDEDGDDDLQISGAVDLETTWCQFRSTCVCSLGGAGGAATGTDGDENRVILEDGLFEYHIIGTVGAPELDIAGTIAAGGLDVSMDAADAEGLEMTEGITARNKHSLVAQTDSGYIEVKLYITDVSGCNDVAVGWRKVEGYEADIATYTDIYTLSATKGDVYIMTALNDATLIIDDTAINTANTTAITLKVVVATDGTVTSFVNGVDETEHQTEYTFDSGDVLVPFFYYLGNSDTPEGTYVMHWKCQKD